MSQVAASKCDPLLQIENLGGNEAWRVKRCGGQMRSRGEARPASSGRAGRRRRAGGRDARRARQPGSPVALLSERVGQYRYLVRLQAARPQLQHARRDRIIHALRTAQRDKIWPSARVSARGDGARSHARQGCSATAVAKTGGGGLAAGPAAAACVRRPPAWGLRCHWLGTPSRGGATLPHLGWAAHLMIHLAHRKCPGQLRQMLRPQLARSVRHLRQRKRHEPC
jgi:hypothetical protein